MTSPGGLLNVTSDMAVDIGEQAFRSHITNLVAPSYGPELTRAYLGGCLAVITHYLIENHGPQAAFELMTEMADYAVEQQVKKGDK